MTHTPFESAANFLLLDDNRIEPNEAGIWIQAAHEASTASHRRLRLCEAGAFLARLFARRPWLDAVQFKLASSITHAGAGKYLRLLRCEVEEVRFVPACALPEGEFPGGEADADVATASLMEDLLDYEFELYGDLRGGHGRLDDLALSLRRAPIESLLQARPLSGAMAVKAWELDKLD